MYELTDSHVGTNKAYVVVVSHNIRVHNAGCVSMLPLGAPAAEHTDVAHGKQHVEVFVPPVPAAVPQRRKSAEPRVSHYGRRDHEACAVREKGSLPRPRELHPHPDPPHDQ